MTLNDQCFLYENSSNKLESIVKWLKIVTLGFIIDISTLNDAVSRKLTIASLQPMFFVDEKSANNLESIGKLLKMYHQC